MKRKNFNLAIIMMVVAAFISVAVVSCKKEDNSSLAGQVTSKPAFTPPQVDDMNAYLKGFKEKMKSSAKGEDEMLSLDDAAWHLSSLANYDFANANVQFTDLLRDTLRYHVNVTDGTIALSDLNAVYQTATNDLDAFYQNLNLDNKHFRFINSSIDEDGNIVMSILVSYNWGDHLWYFPDYLTADSICDLYFYEDTCYHANTNAVSELTRILNLLEGRPFGQTDQRIYYTYRRTKSFYSLDYIDPYGSPWYMNSRLFATLGYFYVCLEKEDMCYLYDSYAGLGWGNTYFSEVPCDWDVDFIQGREQFETEAPCLGHHLLTVKYGIATAANLIEY